MEGTSKSPSHRELRNAWWALGLLALVVAVCSLRRVYDPDLWWHISTGAWIWEHRAIPKTDPFSHTAPGPWRYTEVLAQLWVHGLHALGGVRAVVLGMAVVAAGFVLLTGWLVMEVAEVSIAALAWTMALVGVAAGFRLGPKMDVFSFLALALLLRLLFRVERSGRIKGLLGIPPLMLAWANLHRGGTLGLALLVLVGTIWWLQRRELVLRKAYVVMLGAACLATLCNSGGLWYLRSALGLFAARGYAEWLPEWSAVSWDFLVRINPAFSLVVVLWSTAWLLRPKWDTEAAVSIACLVLARGSVRMVPLAVVALSPGVARGLSFLFSQLGRRIQAVRSDLHAPLGIATGAILVLAHAVATVPASLWGTSVLDWRIPVDAASFLRRAPPPGRMWNSFDYGGYLLYAVREKKVFIDGRNDTVYPVEFFLETARASLDHRVLLNQLERYRIGFAVVACTALEDRRFAWLSENPRWHLVYLDDLAAILVRRNAESEAYIARYGYQELEPHDAVSRAARLTEEPRDRQLAKEIVRNLRESPHSLRAAVLQAISYRRHGLVEQYQTMRLAILALASERGIRIDLPAGVPASDL